MGQHEELESGQLRSLVRCGTLTSLAVADRPLAYVDWWSFLLNSVEQQEFMKCELFSLFNILLSSKHTDD